MFYPGKISVPIGQNENMKQMDKDHVRLTTADFMDYNVGMCYENTPNHNDYVDTSVFARLAPLQAPILAQGTFEYKTYFVPYRILSPQWLDFFNRRHHSLPIDGSNIIVRRMPYVTQSDFTSLFTTTSYGTSVVVTGNYDFMVGSVKRKLTTFGRYCLKILNQLGYQVDFGSGKFELDALRILAYARVYCDWYGPSQYQGNWLNYSEVLSYFDRDNNTPFALTGQILYNIFTLCHHCCYLPDYFTAAFDNFIGPDSQMSGQYDIQIPDVTGGDGTIKVTAYNYNANEDGTPYIEGLDSQGSKLTQYSLDMLSAMTQYIRRYQLAGSVNLDRYLARFGSLITAEKLKRSIYIGEQNTPIETGAVFSTTENDYANVGDYAGKGIVDSDYKEHNRFHFSSNEMGIYLGVFVIRPKIGYSSGLDRHVLHNTVESYYNENFDGRGCRAIASAELVYGNDVLVGDSSFSGDTYMGQVFGTCPVGAEYKFIRDNLSGDFMVPTLEQASSHWHFFRTGRQLAEVFNDNATNAIHTPYFCIGFDAENYGRIFNENEGFDHFQIMLQHKVDARQKTRGLFDFFDFENKGKEVILDSLVSKH